MPVMGSRAASEAPREGERGRGSRRGLDRAGGGGGGRACSALPLVSSLRMARVRMSLARWANLRVLRVSPKQRSAGLMAATMAVLELPPRESCGVGGGLAHEAGRNSGDGRCRTCCRPARGCPPQGEVG